MTRVFDHYVTKPPHYHPYVHVSAYVPCGFSNSASFQSPPYLQIRKQPEEGKPLVGNDVYDGYCAELASAIATELEFDYVLELVKDGRYGERMDDGRWNGMVGELTERVGACSYFHSITFIL